MQNYKYRNQELSMDELKPILDYINQGKYPESFLEAVICNNLLEALEDADETEYENLHAFVGYFCHEAPSNCWGSKEKMEAWIEKKLAERKGD